MDAQDVKTFLECAAANFRPNSNDDDVSTSHRNKAQINQVTVESVMGTDLISMSAEDLCDIFNLPHDLAHSVVQSISRLQLQKLPHSDSQFGEKKPFLEDMAFEDLARCA